MSADSSPAAAASESLGARLLRHRRHLGAAHAPGQPAPAADHVGRFAGGAPDAGDRVVQADELRVEPEEGEHPVGRGVEPHLHPLVGGRLLGAPAGQRAVEQHAAQAAVLADLVHLGDHRAELGDQAVVAALGGVELAVGQLDVAGQEAGLRVERRVGEVAQELGGQVARGAELALLVHRPGRLEQRLRQPVGVVGDLEVVVVGVVVVAVLVGEAAETEPRQVLDGEVAVVHHEGELVGVGGVGDLAQRLGGAAQLAPPGADEAAQVERRAVEPALAAELDQLALRVGQLAGVVGDARLEVALLADRLDRQRCPGRSPCPAAPARPGSRGSRGRCRWRAGGRARSRWPWGRAPGPSPGSRAPSRRRPPWPARPPGNTRRSGTRPSRRSRGSAATRRSNRARPPPRPRRPSAGATRPARARRAGCPRCRSTRR